METLPKDPFCRPLLSPGTFGWGGGQQYPGTFGPENAEEGVPPETRGWGTALRLMPPGIPLPLAAEAG